MKLAMDKVSFKIRLASFHTSVGVDPPQSEYLKQNNL